MVFIESAPAFHYPDIWQDRAFNKTGSTYGWRYDGTRLIFAQCCHINRANLRSPRIAINKDI